MNKDINRLVEETLNSLDNLQATDVPEGLAFKTLNRLNNERNVREVYLFKHPQWLIAALLIGIICNVFFAISYQQNTSGTDSTEVTSFVSHFKLGSTSIY